MYNIFVYLNFCIFFNFIFQLFFYLFAFKTFKLKPKHVLNVCFTSTFYSDLHGSTSSHSGHIRALLQEGEHAEVPRTLQNLPECNGLQHQGKSSLCCYWCFLSFFLPVILLLIFFSLYVYYLLQWFIIFICMSSTF